MRLIDLSIVYLVVGLGCAWALRTRRGSGLDAVLTLALWPLYVPLLLGGESQGTRSHTVARGMSTRVAQERALLVAAVSAARARIHETPLASLLPSETQVTRLFEQIARLDAKAHELDEVLAGDDFARTSSPDTAHSAVEGARRLVAMRERAVRERDALMALCARLRMHMTVLRFSDATTVGEGGDLGELVAEMLGRIEGVGAALEPDAVHPWSVRHLRPQ